MMFAARPAATPDAEWLCPIDRPLPIAGFDMSQRHLAGMGDEDLEAHGLERAEVVGVPPVPGLGNPPVIVEVDGGLAWGWSPEGLANFTALRVGEIKAEAGRRILAAYPLWKQANMTKRASELNDLRFDGELSEDQAAERMVLKAAAAWVDAIRVASNAIEALLPADAAGLAAFDAAAPTDWPADSAPQA